MLLNNSLSFDIFQLTGIFSLESKIITQEEAAEGDNFHIEVHLIIHRIENNFILYPIIYNNILIDAGEYMNISSRGWTYNEQDCLINLDFFGRFSVIHQLDTCLSIFPNDNAYLES